MLTFGFVQIEQRRKLGLIDTSVADADYYALKREREAEEAHDENVLANVTGSRPFSGGSTV